jgi:predicted permease
MDRSSSRSERVFAGLLAWFPREFRERFGEDMRDLFRDQVHAARTRPAPGGVTRLWIRTIPSLFKAALLEHRDARRERPEPSTPRAPRPVRRDGMLATLMSDLRFAGRMLRKSPVFTVVAVLVISIGTGAVTTIFSAMNAVVLRPLPGAADATRLVGLQRTRAEGRGSLSASYGFYEHLRDRSRTLGGVAAWSKADLSIAAGGEGHAAAGNIVTGNYFSVLGVRPALGRFFLPDEDRTPLSHPVVVVSHAFWMSTLGADSAIVGRAISVNGHPYTVIGVAPAGFRGVFTPLRVDAWVPLMMQQQLRPGRDLADAPWLRVFGRLADGVGRDAAHRELQGLAAQWAAQATEPADFRDFSALRVSALTGLPDDARGAFLGFMSLLLGAAGLVLLIASVNVASMLSARAIARRREMAVRTALGAGRWRLVRQLLTETLALFVLGAVGGVYLAVHATRALERIPVPSDAPVALELSPDTRVMAFALLVALATGLVFGLAPALRASRRNITARLREDSAASGTRRGLLGNTLIVGQLAFSLVLLVAAGLFMRALADGQRVDPGFEPAGVATVALNAESWGYDSTRAQEFFGLLRERAAALPGVTAVSYTAVLPLSMTSMGDRVRPTDADPGALDRAGNVVVEYNNVDTDYFTALRIPMVRGRPFAAQDDARAPRVAVVNETLARRLWPDGSALGRTFTHGGDQVTIIGVARDAKYDMLSEDTPMFVYYPLGQKWQPGRTLLVRTAADAAALAPALTEVVRSLDPGLPRPDVITMEQATSVVLLPQRVAALVTGVLGAVGLLMATVGLYGLIAYSVNRRTREIGVRVALGARRSDVLGLVVREGMTLTFTGVTIGLVLAAAATRLMARFLFSVNPLDALTFAGMSVVFIVVSLVASWLPARRAAAADPVAALRTD